MTNGHILRKEVTPWQAFFLYLGYTCIVFLPVFLGRRFFWEDFTLWEYPVRNYAYYMFAIKHSLPFWNPYTWTIAPFLADAQNGFWYPGNMLEILIVKLLLPSSTTVPVVVTEITTLIHLPIAALGMFVLLRKQFEINDRIALLGGLIFAFGARLISEQNHPMFLIQLALLPWEAFLLFRAFRSWKSAFILGLIFGIGFLAGHPQVVIFIGFFLTLLTLWHSGLILKQTGDLKASALPCIRFIAAMIVAAGASAIQLLPLLELTRLTIRQHLDYAYASAGANPFRFLTLIVPKFFGEFPTYVTASAYRGNALWYWEGALYWGVAAEIIAFYTLLNAWKRRSTDKANAAYLFFFSLFALFAFAFAMGKYAGIHWLFWKFVPFFDHTRMPTRMMWFIPFIGSIGTAVGIEQLQQDRNTSAHKKIVFYSLSGLFVLMNALAVAGLFQPLFGSHAYLQTPVSMLHSLVASVLAFGLFAAFFGQKLPKHWLLPILSLLMVADLFYVDVSWHRNTQNPASLLGQDSLGQSVTLFSTHPLGDHGKLLRLNLRETQQPELGMFLHIPIEPAIDSNAMIGLNPLRMSNIFPPVRDSMLGMKIMGITSVDYNDGRVCRVDSALPFLKFYHAWTVAQNRNAEAVILNDKHYDYQSNVILDEEPGISEDNVPATDSASRLHLSSFSENCLTIDAWTSAPQILLVNDLYYPAWQTTVDGIPVKTLRAFSSLRAVVVPAGVHRIDMTYDSEWFAWGWRITVATVIASFMLLLFPRRLKA